MMLNEGGYELRRCGGGGGDVMGVEGDGFFCLC